MSSIETTSFSQEAQAPLSDRARDIEVQNAACDSDAPKGCCGRGKMKRRTIFGICCGTSAVVFALMSLIGFFVLGPSIAKGALDRSVISFDGLNITKVLSGTSLRTSASLTISNIAPLGCSIAEMDVTVMYKNVPFATMTMPAMSVTAYEDNHISLTDRTMYITDNKTWDDFSRAMLRDKIVEWRMTASAKITSGLMGMSVTFDKIPFDKTIPLVCFNGMDDVQMEVFDMSKSTPGKLAVNMKVCLNNPSTIAIQELGDLHFGIYYMGSFMGTTVSDGAAIGIPKSGSSADSCVRFGKNAYNSLALTGSLKPENHSVADELISRYFSGKTSAVSARALSPRASSLPIFNSALQGLSLNTMLNGEQDPLITGLDILSMSLKPVDDDNVDASMKATVYINNPLGPNSGLQIFQVDMTMNMSYGTGLIGTAKTGKTTVPGSPSIFGKGNMTVPVPSIKMTLPDKGAALTKMAKDLIQQTSVTLALTGAADTVALSSALGYRMNIAGVPVQLPNSDARPPLPGVTVAGMGGLKGVKINSYTIPGNVPDGTGGCASKCGILVSITATVTNPAPIGLTVGTLNANIQNHDGVVLGQVTTTGLTLSPGDNTVTMSGRIAPVGDAAISAASDFFSTYLTNKDQVTKVVGTDAKPSTVKWLNDVVHGMELSTTFPGAGDGFSVLTDINIEAMDMALSANGDPQVSATIQAKMQMPAGVDMSIITDITSADMELDMIDPDTGKSVGHLSIPASQATIKYQAGLMTATFKTTTMKVADANGFSQVVKDLLLNKQKVVTMAGLASPTALTNMGTLKLKNIPFSSSATLRGFNAFADYNSGKSLMQVNSLDVVGGKNGALDLKISCQVTNPSNVAVSMGPMSLELWTSSYGGTVKLGVLHIDDFALGANSAGTYVTKFDSVTAVYTPPTSSPEAVAAGRAFLSAFVLGKAQTVIIRGAADGSGTDIGFLKPALEALSTTSTAPGLAEHNLLVKGLMHLPSVLSLKDLPTQLLVQNPLTADMNFVKSNCDIFACKTFSGKRCSEYYDTSTGFYSPDTVNEMVPGKGQTNLKIHPVKLKSLLTPEMIKTFFTSAGGGSFIRLKGVFQMTVGGTELIVDYEETDVPICLIYPFHDCTDFMAESSLMTESLALV